MAKGPDKQRAPDSGEVDSTVIDEEMSVALSSALLGGRATYPQPHEEPESDGQETLVWDGTMLSPEQYAGAVEHTQIAPPDQLLDEHTRALESADLEDVDPPQQNAMPYVDPRAWFLGRSFGGFRVVCELASGGMATVFLGRKEGPARVSKHAAVKVVHPHLAFEREFVDMFLDEARIAACVSHPNVCRVLDFGMAEGTYYLAMEYMLGETWSTVRSALAEHPDGQRMLPAIAAHVVAQACEGLHAAHEASDDEGRHLHIVHRDVSPQNIFVAYDGTVRVLDFGIARAADRITSTRDGMLKGRLAYMSPEQMANEPISRAADIWSIGVVLREALEGKRLFRRGTDAETMFAVTTEPMPAWTVEVPDRLRAAVERALERSPSSRYMTAHDMALDLTRFVSAERRTVNTSELSSFMKLLFGAQMEQKRALLQLPIPTPQGAPTLDRQPMAHGLRAFEPRSGTDMLEDIEQVHAERSPPRRARWLNVSALIALGSLGAFSGILAGKLLGGGSEQDVPPAAEGKPEPGEPTDVARSAERAAEPPPRLPPRAIETVAETRGRSAPAVPPLQAPASRPAAPAREPVGRVEEGTRVGPAQGAAEPSPPRPRRGRDSAEATSATPRQRSARSEATGSAERTNAPAVTADAAPGTIMVAFEGGWAEVYLGEKLLGTTPGRFSVPSGKQTLTIRPFGTGRPFTRRAEVKPGEVTKLFLSGVE